ncbi:L,D-transpeptidase family protein [Methylomagnum sp.]
MSESASKAMVLARWLLIATAAGGGVFAYQVVVPFSLTMPPLDGNAKVDPRVAIGVAASGVGARLSLVELRDGAGNVVAQAADPSQTRFEWKTPLAFGTRYTLKATAERPWFGQRETRELAFGTVEIPKLEGLPQRTLEPDASVTLRFDRPVGELRATGDMKIEARPDAAHQVFRLVASGYEQGRSYPLALNWQTDTGVPLPPLPLEITTAPPLTATLNTQGLSNLGLAMPLQVTFSEPLASRDNPGKHIAVSAKDGKGVEGKWQWVNKHRLQFTPRPTWPASTAIEVSIDPTGPRSARGGFLDKALAASFTTGPDRRIVVYLDAQKADAIENGQVVRTFHVSTGKATTPTVTGNFHIYARFPTKTMRSRAKPGEKGHYVVENVPYAQYFYEDYAFHGAWWHNGFGHPASHGCVNMSTRKNNKRWPSAAEDAGWLYQWASLGVPVSVLPSGGAASTHVAMQ